MTDVQKMLDEATTRPWVMQSVERGRSSCYSGDWFIWGAPSAVSIGDVIDEADAKVIVYAVNNLAAYARVAEAARDLRSRTLRATGQFDAWFEERELSDALDALLAEVSE